ncbi:PEGA domain-containing protein [Chondromyces crocatus]|uniref:PEGA domain-containing protein n=1 Tax=Chondromyces crocatus TaxID=52 RepID=A0A0K1EC69_CHOCO|nr:PEGA domain-containing protein [Chondromyces crocatus]AKT38158.1 uncharacterized protein CMC5_023010 [Chondromyces crocatus]
MGATWNGCGHLSFSLVLLLAGATAATSRDALAGEPSVEARARARALLLDGRTRLAAGDAQVAVRYFRAAHALMGVPTTGLDLSRGLAALGDLVEAHRMALGVARSSGAPGEAAAFGKARVAAAALADALERRIPALVVTVRPRTSVRLQVLVDGAAIPAEAVGTPWRVNPGEHTVVVSAEGFLDGSRTVAVREGESLPVELSLDPARRPSRREEAFVSLVPTGEESALHVSSKGPASRSDATETRTEVPSWAWLSGSVGLVALGVGVAFTIDHAATRATVAADCPMNSCLWPHYDDARAMNLERRWNRSLGLAIGCGVAGVLGVGTAIYGVASAGAGGAQRTDDNARRRVSVVPWASQEGGGVSVGGRF